LFPRGKELIATANNFWGVTFDDGEICICQILLESYFSEISKEIEKPAYHWNGKRNKN